MDKVTKNYFSTKTRQLPQTNTELTDTQKITEPEKRAFRWCSYSDNKVSYIMQATHGNRTRLARQSLTGGWRKACWGPGSLMGKGTKTS